MADPKRAGQGTQDGPSEEEMLRLLRQDAKRKEYMQSPKAKAKRTEYQARRKNEAKAARDIVANNPEMLEKLIAKDPSLAILRKKS